MTSRDPVPSEFPAGLTFDLPLWSKRDEKFLRQEYSSDPWAYVRGYQQRVPQEDAILFSDLTKFLLYHVRVTDLLLGDASPPHYGGFDPSGPNRVGNALVSAAVNPSGLRVITGIGLWQGSGKETATRLASAYERFRYTLLIVENNALQDVVIEVAHDACPALPIRPFMTGRNKAKPEEGLPGLAAEVSRGVWALCMGDAYDTGAPLQDHDAACGCPYHKFLEDLAYYPEPGRPYDTLMAWWFCREGIRGADRLAAALEAAERPPERDIGSVPQDEVGGRLW